MKKVILVLGLLVLLPAPVSAQGREEGYNIGEIVVTSSRFPELAEEGTGTVDVLAEDRIEGEGFMVGDVLDTVSGIDTAKAGGLGGTTTLYLRGANPQHVLVMIDGIEINDPMSPTRLYDWAHLLTDGIERIEVVKGPQSILYGSDAMAGVINIITKEGTGKPAVEFMVEGGSYTTFKEDIYSYGKVKKGAYSIGLTRLDSDGYSKAEGGTEADGYSNTTFNGKFSYSLSDRLECNAVLRYTTVDNDLDDGGFDDDPNYTEDIEFFAGKIGVGHQALDNWQHNLIFSWSSTRRDYRDKTDTLEPFESSKAWYDGTLFKVDWQNKVGFGEKDTLIGGIEFQEEKGKGYYLFNSLFGPYVDDFQKRVVDTLGFYLQNTVKVLKNIILRCGLRYEDHNEFGGHTDYKLEGRWQILHNTVLKAGVNTGFKAPSLYQLYSIYGNSKLAPEEVTGYEAGIEQGLFDGRLKVGFNYFNSDYNHLIDFDFATLKYMNVDEVKIWGIELNGSWQATKQLNLRLGYTYLDIEDSLTGKRLYRRPNNKVVITADWVPTERLGVTLLCRWTDDRLDVDPASYPVKDVVLQDYWRIDLKCRYYLRENVEIFVRVENLLDQDYTEVYGYKTPGISGYGGMKIRI